MTEAQKDKLWVDYFVTRFFWNKITNHDLPIIGILDFHIEYESLISNFILTLYGCLLYS